MKLGLCALCCSWLYLVAGLAHAVEPTATNNNKPRYADVAVETQSLGSAGPVVRRRVRERADVVLRRGAVLPARDGDDPVISVTIDELPGDDPGYAFKVEILRGGVPTEQLPAVECKLCTEGELVDAVEGRLEHAVADLPVVASTVPLPRVDPTPTDTAPLPPKPRSPAMRIAGATLTGVGLGATIAGIVLAALPPEPTENPDGPPGDLTWETSTTTPGYAVLGAGLAVAVTGAVLLIVDARKRAGDKRRRRSQTARAR
ncbi:MAG: hypothetical protein IAG13_02355 [Deltaproteobacteria bacterium]|nr:hypothetical protein [Nannocystaceae bacterium]